MSKILLGIAIGYICSDMIDELLGKASNSEKAPAYRPTPPSPTPPETTS